MGKDLAALPQGAASHQTRVPAQAPAGPELLGRTGTKHKQSPPAGQAGGDCFIVNSDTHLPTQGWLPALPRRGRDDTPYITYMAPCRIPVYHSRPPCCADPIPDQQRLPPDPLPRPRRNQPQPCPLGQRRRHRRLLPQRRLLLRRHCRGDPGPLRHLHQPQEVPRQSNRGGHEGHEHHESTGTRANCPGPPPYALRPYALRPRPYALRLWRRSVPIPNSRDHPAPDVACQPPTLAPRATPARVSALGRRRTPPP